MAVTVMSRSTGTWPLCPLGRADRTIRQPAPQAAEAMQSRVPANDAGEPTAGDCASTRPETSAAPDSVSTRENQKTGGGLRPPRTQTARATMTTWTLPRTAAKAAPIRPIAAFQQSRLPQNRTPARIPALDTLWSTLSARPAPAAHTTRTGTA